MAAAPATRGHGWTGAAMTTACHGDILSMRACHFGIFLGFFGPPILLRCRSARSSSPAPMAILTASTAADGGVLGPGGLLPVARTVSAITIARDRNQPKTNAAPFLTPRSEARTRRNAVSGSGSSGIASPLRTRSRITIGSGCRESRRAISPALLPDEPDKPSPQARRQAPSWGAGGRGSPGGFIGDLPGPFPPSGPLLRPLQWAAWAARASHI